MTFNSFKSMCRCVVMYKNYFSMSACSFWTFTNQTFLQLYYFVLVVIRINSFTWFQKIMIYHTYFDPTKHRALFFLQSDLALLSILTFYLDQSIISCVPDFQNKTTFHPLSEYFFM